MREPEDVFLFFARGLPGVKPGVASNTSSRSKNVCSLVRKSTTVSLKIGMARDRGIEPVLADFFDSEHAGRFVRDIE